jgi:predicted dehydrogenase
MACPPSPAGRARISYVAVLPGLKIRVLQPVATGKRWRREDGVTEIGIGLVGGGYMGKAHAVALSAVGAVFDTDLRPRLEVICASSDASADRYRKAYGFARATSDWRDLVADPAVEAIVIASPQTTHRAIAEAAFALGKPVFCEKPLGASLEDARALTAAAEAAGVVQHDRLQLHPHARHAVRAAAAGRGRHRGRHVVPGRAYRGFPRRSRHARQLAHDRAGQRHDGRSGART